jgi:hypothetical protein
MKIDLTKKYRVKKTGLPILALAENPFYTGTDGYLAKGMEFVGFFFIDNPKRIFTTFFSSDDIEEVQKFEGINRGDQCLFWNNGGKKIRGYFATAKDSYAHMFSSGGTEWSKNGAIYLLGFKFCEKVSTDE